MDCRSESAAVRGVAAVVETHAVCQDVQLCAGAFGESAGECRAGSLDGAQGGGEPLRRGTEPFGLAVKRAQCPPGHRWESAQGNRKAAVWGRGTNEAGAACV